jgi:hypothetical protein
MTMSPEKGGVWHVFSQGGFLTLEIEFYKDFRPIIMGFLPFFEDLEPRLRPFLGRKLGCDPQIKLYINHVFLQSWRGLEQQNDE